MTESGKRAKPGRILIVAVGRDLERVIDIMVRQGHLVEATRNPAAAVKRLAQRPGTELVLVGGLSTFDRTRVMAAASEAGVWCAYLKGMEDVPDFSPEERSSLLATIDSRADDDRIAKSIERLLAARRAPSASEDEDVG